MTCENDQKLETWSSNLLPHQSRERGRGTKAFIVSIMWTYLIRFRIWFVTDTLDGKKTTKMKRFAALIVLIHQRQRNMLKKVLNTSKIREWKQKAVYHKLYHTMYFYPRQKALDSREELSFAFENELVPLCCRFMITSRMGRVLRLCDMDEVVSVC